MEEVGSSSFIRGCSRGCFFRWERCFSRSWRRPSFVKGLGRMSAMPVIY